MRSSCITSTTTAREQRPRAASPCPTSATSTTTTANVPCRYCQNFRLLHWDQDDLTTSWIRTTPTQEKRQLNSITRPSRPSKRNSMVRPTTWPSSLQASATELAVLIGNISSRCQSTMVHQEHPDSLRTSVP